MKKASETESASASESASESGKPSRVRITPVTILASVAVLFAILLLFAPRHDSKYTEDFSSYSVGSGGLLILYETVSRLGYTTSRRLEPFPPAIEDTDRDRTIVIMSPKIPLEGSEIGALVQFVRDGGSLVYGGEGKLLDSFNVDLPLTKSLLFNNAVRYKGDQITLKRMPPLIPSPNGPYIRVMRTPFAVIQDRDSTVALPTEDFLWYESQDKQADPVKSVAIRGTEFGKGKVVIVSYPLILSNTNEALPLPVVGFMQGLLWLGNRHVEFSEYHHGFGEQKTRPNLYSLIFLSNPAGRAVLHLIAGFGLLVLVYAHRPILPSPSRTLKQRRSSIEHVEALGNLYKQAAAEELAISRLITGLRHRHPFNIAASLSDNEYLDRIVSYFPSISASVMELKQPSSLKNVGLAIASIESELALLRQQSSAYRAQPTVINLK